MKVFKTKNNLIEVLDSLRSENKSIGFVPTMGALHQGHLSLLKEANTDNDISVCSIFVNPTQFNNPEDLIKYPRTLEVDKAMLKDQGCDILFCPEVEEMYPDNESEETFNFGFLEQVMEGKDRPGHFQGVGQIVKKLFEIVMPHKAYFGKKDYQQLQVIKSLTEQYNLSPEIVGCDIVREEDGLAMSSRNQRLSEEQRRNAPQIYQCLKEAKTLHSTMAPAVLKNWVEQKINSNPLMELVYFEVSDASTLQVVEKWESSESCMGFIVVAMGDIRLIDNIQLK